MAAGTAGKASGELFSHKQKAEREQTGSRKKPLLSKPTSYTSSSMATHPKLPQGAPQSPRMELGVDGRTKPFLR